ncbi:MAG: restriction endonuclease subunit S [Rubricoccaceae bacterium]
MSEILLDRLNRLADTPEAIDGLRQLVLDLAVRGKLTKQDASDEPASALLERIAAEKARLTKAGEIRKPKALPPVELAEQPFELPEGWAWARFGDVADIASNLEDPTLSSRLPHIAPNHIEKDTGRLLPYGTVAEDGVTSNKHRFFPGQILYSKIRPNLNKAVIVDFEGLCSADMYPLESHLDTRYLHLYILSPAFVVQVVSDDNRLAMPKVNQTQLQRVLVPVSPEAEQRRIVARVDELMALCDELATRLRQRDALRQTWTTSTVRHVSDEAPIGGAPAWDFAETHVHSLLSTPEAVPQVRQLVLDLAVRGKLTKQDASDEPASALLERIAAEKARLYKAGEIRKPKALPPVELAEQPFELPERWAWTRFDKTCVNRDAERVPVSRAEREKRQGPFDYYGASGVIDCIDDYLFDKPLLLVGEDGANLLLRSKPIAFIAEGKYWVNNHAHVVDALDRVTLDYLAIAIGAIDLSPWVTGTAQPKLNQSKLNSIPIPFPPLAEQTRIVETVARLMSLCHQLDDELATAARGTERLMETVLAEALAVPSSVATAA